MKLFPLLVFPLFLFGWTACSADKGSYVDTIQFIEYTDENTALEEIKNGNLDLYYYRIPPERIEDPKSREELSVFQSTGGSYSILINPAESEKFNPFSLRETRFALNYLIDRELIVNEFLGGYGIAMISAYAPFDPDYLLVLEELESFNFRYNPILAEEIISSSLLTAGAEKIDGRWFHNSKPIEIIIFIRSDDPVRKSIGEVLSAQLEKIGFTVKKDFGDLNKAFTIVYGSDPAEQKWNIYTEGWAGRSAFVRYDTLVTAQMYSPWYCNTPGLCDPTYWNYQNATIDVISQNVFNGNFTSAQGRANLLKQATSIGVQESVRVFLASKIDVYVTSDKIKGIVNDFGAGVPSRFTPINIQSDSDLVRIGVKQIYQGAWNPIGGLSDLYSRAIWDIISDPATFKHPYTGLTIPIRTQWKVDAGGPDAKFEVPKDAIKWNSTQQSWIEVGEGNHAITKVTFDLKFGNWHNGQPMDMNDILYPIYFMYEWTCDTEDDKTCDSEYSPKAYQATQTLAGIRVIDSDTIEVYQNYWHFDQAEIADSAAVWAGMPWEVIAAMEKSVTDGKVAFSRSNSVGNNIGWLSLLIPDDATQIKSNLEEFKKTNFIPTALTTLESDHSYFDARYDSTISWIEKKNHAVISNGPFYMENYSPEARTITVRAFDDPKYPFKAGHWREFTNVRLSTINRVDIPDFIKKGDEITVPIFVNGDSTIYYYFINANNEVVVSGTKKSGNNKIDLTLSKDETSLFSVGANDLKIFSVSDSALRPDIFRTSFLVVNEEFDEPTEELNADLGTLSTDQDYLIPVLVIIAIIIVFFIFLRKRKQASHVISKEDN
ncbi:MAG: ABC transporter substrate-binding protein [Nitrosopumilaceae archaeon]